MSSVVCIISIPTEEHEKCLMKKIKKKVTGQESGQQILHSESIGKIELKNVQIEKSMEQIIKNYIKEMELVDITWRKTEDGNHYQIMLPIEGAENCEEILQILKENGIGDKLNSKIRVMPCTIHYHGQELNENQEIIIEEDDDNVGKCNKKDSGWNLFVSSVRSRLTVAQVVENVKAKAAMTFDFIMLLLISTVLCALGLVENNSIYMLSSMLISPMMGPVMAGTFGSVIRDINLQKTGVKNELIGLGIATLVGFFYGSIICITTDKYGTTEWPTYEMYSRGQLRSLWVGAIIALLSGAAVALGVLSDNIASLVGVAISTSLMPPAVNAGLLWSLGCTYYLKSDEITRYSSLTHTDYYSKNSAIELTYLGAISLCLTFVNIICIYVAGILVFMIKEVTPHACRDNVRRQFWQHDIKVTRDYNRTIQHDAAAEGVITDNNGENIFENLRAAQQAGNLRLSIKRPEFITWSPSNFEELNNTSLLANNYSQNRGKHRRLSQIFQPLFKTNKESVSVSADEKTPLLSMNNETTSSTTKSGNTFLLSSGKKITVIPCDTP